MRIGFSFLSILLFVSSLFSQTEYLWPTNASYAMTSSFAESRPGRFHAGIDIKTWGQTGYDIYAIRDGYISRIRVSPFGYGRGLYLTLDTGETVVFGHLERFIPKIEEWVWQEQQKRGRYGVQLFPPKDKFVFKAGDLIGYTGETGIGHPHLHFELRDEQSRPINPLLKEYKLKDTLPPNVSKILVKPMNAYSTVNNDWQPEIIVPTKISQGVYEIAEPITLTGHIGFGVSAFDQMDDITNKFGTHVNQLFIDDSLVFTARYDRFSYSENNQLKLDRDFRQYKNGNGYFYNLYREQGNELGFYSKKETFYGVTAFADRSDQFLPIFEEGIHSFKIICKDYWGNVSQITGKIEAKSDEAEPGLQEFNDAQIVHDPIQIKEEFYDNYIRFSINLTQPLTHVIQAAVETCMGDIIPLQTKFDGKKWLTASPLSVENLCPGKVIVWAVDENKNVFTSEKHMSYTSVAQGQTRRVKSKDRNAWVDFNGSSLFRDIFVRTGVDSVKSESKYSFKSLVYTIDPQDVALNKGATVSIKYPDDFDSQKLGIYSKTKKGWAFQGNEQNPQWKTITTHIAELGSFCLIEDCESPQIQELLPANNAQFNTTMPRLSATFVDSLSGISGEDNMSLILDGQKLIAEYDFESKSLFFTPREPLSKGRHTIEIKIVDNCGNAAANRHEFFIN